MQTFMIVVGLIILFIACVWSRGDIFNAIIKFGLFLVVIWDVILLMPFFQTLVS